MALAEAGVELLQEGGLLWGDIDDLAGINLLQRQDRLEPIAAVGRVLQNQGPDALHDLGRSRLRVGLVDRRQVRKRPA